ncbi:sensor histidine kinase N-terminal domain-containing protein [Uliginosibacterium sp. 31-16]|uniref:sensor histidine kinase n=1 Tax=Uliginosibacterium sp. 31-16 TaxID=3068315 RepID=UPI00273D2CD2|nr:sensor histidine kinase [Uliginosibacterium sp. 31-16]MDP5241247.1 sensor histidine kinase N-terminal domain-containing protein [Uliginosibacterium sp. 31-16]
MLKRLSGSLRRRLALILLPSLLVLLLASAFVQYLLAVRPMQREFDRAMSDVAVALAEHVVVEDSGDINFVLSDEAAALLDADALDYNWYAAFDERFKRIAGEEGIEWPAVNFVRGEPYYFDTVINDRPVRAVAVKKACGALECGVVLAATLKKRGRLIRDMQLSALVPVVLAGSVAFALVWFGLGSGLRPLVRLSREIGRRSPRDLSPVKLRDAPDEISPLVSAVNRLMQQLGEANQAQQAFLATAAHQLRTPLAGLQSRIELALLETRDPENRVRLGEIHESAVRSARLAVQLLSLARVEPGASVADAMLPVDLAKLAAELVDEWVPRAINSQIDLGFELAAAPVQGSPLLLREMMVNLLHNALEYTPAGGRVTVHAGQMEGRSFFAVEDNGPGIPPELHSKVLERFVRLPGTRGSGSGLGLAIVAEIAAGHQARLELLEAPGGQGLLARVRFASEADS